MTDNNNFSVPLPQYVKVPLEKQIIQKDFRGYLTRAITWTALMPLFVLAFMHLHQITQQGEENDLKQIELTQQISRQISSEIAHIKHLLDNGAESLYLQSEGHSQFFEEWKQKKLKDTPALARIFVSGQGDPKPFGVRGSETKESPAEALVQKTVGENLQKSRRAEKQKTLIVTSVETNRRAELCFSKPLFFDEKDWLTACFPVTHFSEIENVQNKIVPFSIYLFDQEGRSLFSKTDTESIALSACADEQLFRNAQANARSGVDLWRRGSKRNESHIYSVASIAPTDWVLVLGQSLALRDKELLNSLKTSGILLVLAVLAAMVVGTFLGRQLNLSVTSLIEQLNQFESSGKVQEMSPFFKSTAPLELQHLARQYEKMAKTVLQSRQKLEDANQYLSQQVELRTASLNRRKEELKSLQWLLAPLEEPVNIVIDKTAEKFKEIFGLSTLFFSKTPVTNDELQSLEVKAADNSEIGYLCFSPDNVSRGFIEGPLTRLAHSIAIVLDNQEMYSSFKTSSARFTALMESMTEGTILVGRTGSLLYGNKTARIMLDLGADEAVANIEEWIRKKFRPSEPEEEMDSEKGFSDSKRYVSTTDSDFFIEISQFKVPSFYGFSGERTGLLLRDISKEVVMERMKENLVSMVAHELKTPVTTMRLQVETLRWQLHSGNAQETFELLQEMLEESSRLQRLVEDWLDISRIDSGTIVIRPKIYAVKTLLESAKSAVKRQYPELAIDYEIESGAECVRADKDRLIQVFINIFTNAARYRSKSSPVCKVKAYVRGEELEMAFEDNGRGIKENYLSKIFDVFYQIEMGNDRKVGGTGLGLAICRGIMAAHGGRIWAEKNVREGTTFKLRLSL